MVFTEGLKINTLGMACWQSGSPRKVEREHYQMSIYQGALEVDFGGCFFFVLELNSIRPK